MTAHNTIQFGSGAWKRGFTMVPNTVLEAEHLTPGAKLAFALLMKFGRDKGSAYPGQKRMSEAVGCTEKTLRIYLDELKSVGLVEVQRRGQGLTNLYVLHPERELLPVGSVEKTDLELPLTTDKEDTGKEDTEKEDAPAERDRAQDLYDEYLRIVTGAKESKPITPSLRRTADKALAEFDLPELVTALRGFVNWRRKKPGDKRFSSIFASHPGGRPLHDHIDFWITQASDASGLDGFTSETQVKIHRAVRDVQRAFGSNDPDTQATGAESLAYLKERGIEPESAPDGSLFFPSLGGKA
jgi:hypothetical protein